MVHVIDVEQSSDAILEASEESRICFHTVPTNDRKFVEEFITTHQTEQNFQDDRGWTQLHLAAKAGVAESILSSLLSGPAVQDISTKNEDGDTPLHFAARYGHSDVLQQLCSNKGISLEVFNTKMLTPLHCAAESGGSACVQFLLDEGASLDKRDAYGNTPLHLAARKGSSPEVIEMLVERGANVFAANDRGELPLDLARPHDKNGREGLAVVSVLKALRRRGVIEELMTKHNNGATLLHYAAGYATHSDISWLIEMISKDELKWADNSDRNALHWAAWKGNEAAVELLVNGGIDVLAECSPFRDSFRYGGWSHNRNDSFRPLCLALIYGHLSVAEKLLQLKGEQLQKLLAEDFAMWAIHFQYSDRDLLNFQYIVADNLLNFSREISPFYIALHARKSEIVKFMEKHTIGDHIVNEKSSSDRTALHYATLLNDIDVVKKLCRHDEGFNGYGKHLSPLLVDKYGKNAVQYAVKLEHRQIMRELMERNDVRRYVEELYRSRQLYVDAANAILVGAVLIAGVTFAGWLQPPLGNSKQEYPKHVGIRIFWSLNSLSFLFAMSTVLAGAGAVLPTDDIFIAEAVIYIRQGLLLAATLLSFSIIFVVGAFIAAGFVVLPSSFKYEENMMATTIAGGMVFVMSLSWFIVSLYRLRPSWMKIIFRGNTHKNFYNEYFY